MTVPRISTARQQYERTATVINELRVYVDQWRSLDAKDWRVTPETAPVETLDDLSVRLAGEMTAGAEIVVED
jgi:hypothetical protein